MADQIEFTSRYDVFGPPNGCKGQCEGTGWVPIHANEDDPVFAARWAAAHQDCSKREEGCDGWHFVKCPDCRP